MATIVLGLGVSHTPMMSLPSTDWAAYAARDATAFPLIYRRKRWEYEDLVAARASEGIADQVNEATFAAKHARITAAVDRLSAELAQARPDVLVVVGDDHHEMYTEASMPTLAIYWGDTIESIPPQTVFPAVAPAAWALFGEERETYQCDAALGEHLITRLNADGFDVAQLRSAPEGQSVGHPFVLVRTRLVGVGREMPPIVPVIMNTYFPPNRPTPKRCWEFGKGLREAIEAYPADVRVAVVASGGLSHFVVDEELDRSMLDAMASGDDRRVAELDLEDFSSGTSEGLCWLTAGGACHPLSMEVVEYVPGYRTPAGTGCAMAAVVWK